MASKSLTFDIFGRDKTASKTMNKIGANANTMGERFKKVGKAIGVGLLAIAAGAVKIGVDAAQALIRIEKIGAQTNAVIKSTGGIANVTADHVNKLADSLERATATEAESIVEGANLLLTFKNIRNESGKGNDIFDQTTKVMVDLARAMGTDAKSGAIQLGKALNDPTDGITQLSRVGVTFSKKNEDLIRSLTESGDVMGAQKIILKELQDQFGGSGAAFAGTFAGKIELIGHRFGEVSERVVAKLMPALEDLLGFVESDLMNGIDSFGGWLAEEGIPALKETVKWVIEWKDILGPTAVALGGATAAMWLLNIAMDSNPIGLVILALGALVTAATLVATNWETIVDGFILPISRFEISLSSSILRMARNVAGGFEDMVNGALGALQRLVGPLNGLLAATGKPQIVFGKVDFTSGIDSALGAMNVAAAAANGWRPGTGAQNPVAPPAVAGRKAALFADGGFVKARPGGVFANIGEGRHDEVVLPLSPQILKSLSGGRQQAPTTFIFEGAGGELARLFNIYEKKADGRRVLVQKMGKQVTA